MKNTISMIKKTILVISLLIGIVTIFLCIWSNNKELTYLYSKVSITGFVTLFLFAVTEAFYFNNFKK